MDAGSFSCLATRRVKIRCGRDARPVPSTGRDQFQTGHAKQIVGAGPPYASGEYRALLAATGLVASMSRKGNFYDNAAMESFNATYKRECVGLAEVAGGYAPWAEAKTEFFRYVGIHYHQVRRHSALGIRSSVDFELQLNQAIPIRPASPRCPTNRVKPNPLKLCLFPESLFGIGLLGYKEFNCFCSYFTGRIMP